MNLSLSLGMNNASSLFTTFVYPFEQFFPYGVVVDRFEAELNNGVWTLESNLADNTPSNKYGGLVFADSNNTAVSVKRRTPFNNDGKHRLTFNLKTISGNAVNAEAGRGGRPLILTFRDPDGDSSTTPNAATRFLQEGDNSIEFTVFDDALDSPTQFNPSVFLSSRPWSRFKVEISKAKLTHLDY